MRIEASRCYHATTCSQFRTTWQKMVPHVIVSFHKRGCILGGFLILSDSLYKKRDSYVEKADTLKTNPEFFNKQGEVPFLISWGKGISSLDTHYTNKISFFKNCQGILACTSADVQLYCVKAKTVFLHEEREKQTAQTNFITVRKHIKLYNNPTPWNLTRLPHTNQMRSLCLLNNMTPS